MENQNQTPLLQVQTCIIQQQQQALTALQQQQKQALAALKQQQKQLLQQSIHTIFVQQRQQVQDLLDDQRTELQLQKLTQFISETLERFQKEQLQVLQEQMNFQQQKLQIYYNDQQQQLQIQFYQRQQEVQQCIHNILEYFKTVIKPGQKDLVRTNQINLAATDYNESPEDRELKYNRQNILDNGSCSFQDFQLKQSSYIPYCHQHNFTTHSESNCVNHFPKAFCSSSLEELNEPNVTMDPTLDISFKEERHIGTDENLSLDDSTEKSSFLHSIKPEPVDQTLHTSFREEENISTDKNLNLDNLIDKSTFWDSVKPQPMALDKQPSLTVDLSERTEESILPSEVTSCVSEIITSKESVLGENNFPVGNLGTSTDSINGMKLDSENKKESKRSNKKRKIIQESTAKDVSTEEDRNKNKKKRSSKRLETIRKSTVKDLLRKKKEKNDRRKKKLRKKQKIYQESSEKNLLIATDSKNKNKKSAKRNFKTKSQLLPKSIKTKGNQLLDEYFLEVDSENCTGKSSGKKNIAETESFQEDLNKLREPFKHGWKREIVYRRIVSSLSNKADIYYYSPENKKFRSSVEIEKVLKSSSSTLTIENFSYVKKPLGTNDPKFEIVRFAKNRFEPKPKSERKSMPNLLELQLN